MFFPHKKPITNKRLGQLTSQRYTHAGKAWRDFIIARDKMCLYPHKTGFCGKTEKLQAHHIRKFSTYKHLRFEKFNGITLCEECHKKIFGIEEKYEEIFFGIIRRLYYGQKPENN